MPASEKPTQERTHASQQIASFRSPRRRSQAATEDDEAVGGFEIDDHLSVWSLPPSNDGTPEACRSFVS